jgi:hypothetical protein
MNYFDEIELFQHRHHQEMDNLDEKRILTLIGVLKPKLSKAGNMWRLLYGRSPQEGVAGFGGTPYEAIINFDRNFREECSK